MRLALSQRWIGILEMIGAGLAFGSLGVCGKRAFEAGLTPGEFLFFRFAVSSLALGAWFLWRSPRALLLPRAAWVAAVPLGALGYGFFSWTYFRGLEGMPASLAVLILFSFPAVVAMGGAVFLKERLNA
ncbi:MAG: DMT family transporter, partial [Bdellovibrionales bacterium]|nr:DMT family transporter [Bdellovibrionales bacterium]